VAGHEFCGESREEQWSDIMMQRDESRSSLHVPLSSIRARTACRSLPVLIAMLLGIASVAAQPAAFTKQTESVEIAGYREDVDIYRPAAGPSEGVAIVAHGFTRSRIRHSDLGRALAESGVTAVIPDLPNVVDQWGNGDAIVDLMQKLEAGTVEGFPAGRSHVVLIGTSAGGLATVLAAAKLPGLAGWIGLDPVDRTGTGSNAAEQLRAPAIVLLGGASGCNLFGSGRTIARALPHLVRTTAMKGASHCDFEDPTTNLCRVLCGGSSREMRERIRDETVRSTLELLGMAAGTAPESGSPDAVDTIGPPGPGDETPAAEPIE
jgi:pimeloyl-ACP methyl ester carboxylesterase